MKKRVLWGGILAVLIVANISKYLLPASGSILVNVDQDEVIQPIEVPLWLDQEMVLQQNGDADEKNRNFFQLYHASNPGLPIEDAGFATVTKPVNVEPDQIKTDVPQLQFQVLAINIDGHHSSAMIKSRGKSQLVFVGDVVFDQYRVKDITSETVYIDLLP